MATRIDGKALAAKVKAQTAEVAKSLYRRPGLAVILVGNDPASRVYVTGKEKDCAECGFLSFEHALPEDTTQETLLDLIQELKKRNPGLICSRCFKVDGKLVDCIKEPKQAARLYCEAMGAR